jgi:nicotinate-nucleotide adenylyltransferase
MKIGVFGGTFDPPHNGHLIVAGYVRYRLGLDRIVFVPSWISPHKQSKNVADPLHRLAMLRAALGEKQEFEVSDIEVRRGGVSYTADTLRSLADTTHADLFLLIGADNFAEFWTWHDPEGILSLARLVVMTRPGSVPPMEATLPAGGVRVAVPEIAVASTEIRSRIGEGRSVRHLLPAGVESYIRSHGLYKEAP